MSVCVKGGHGGGGGAGSRGWMRLVAAHTKTHKGFKLK